MFQKTKQQKQAGFTILEVLVASAVLVLILGVTIGIVDSVQSIQRRGASQTKAFRDGRVAMDVLSTTISQATLNTYLDYVDSKGNYRFSSSGNATTAAQFIPFTYKRTSELRFLSGNISKAGSSSHSVFFQAPLGLVGSNSTYAGLENLLNSVGFFIEFGDDSLQRPDFFSSMPNQPVKTYRYRLMQAIQPAESLSIYNYTAGNPGLKSSGNGTQWITDTLGSTKRIVADNIIALIILPKLGAADQKQGNYAEGALAPKYLYDSTATDSDPALNPSAQLPPVLEITIVAVDEKSFARFQGTSTTAPTAALGLSSLFQTVGDTVDSTKPGYAKDMQALEKTLTDLYIDYRIFKVTVPIKSARWSRDQKG